MDKDEYLKQAADQIKVYIANSDFQKANGLILKTLTYFPNATKIQKLRKEIIKEVKNRNKELVKFKIVQAKRYSKEENYPEAIKLLKEAQKLAIYSDKINRLLFKNQKKYKEYLQNYFQTNFIEQEKRLENLFKENPDKMIEVVKQLELNSPPNKKIQKMISDYQNKYLDYKIRQNKNLLNSTKYTSIETLIKTLKSKTRENNPIIRELETKIKLRQLQDQKYEKYDFIYENKKNLNTLIQLKKYPKALQFTEELLKIVPDDKTLLKTQKKLQRKLFHINRDQVIDLIISEQKKKKEKKP